MTFCIPALVLLSPTPAAAGAGDEAEARKAAGACLAAIRGRDWKALAGKIDPASLHAFRAAAEPALKKAAAPKGGKPDFQDGVVLGMLNGADPGALAALPPEKFFPAFVEATSPGLDQRLPGGMEARVVGLVHEGPDAIHAVYRARGKVRLAAGSDDPGTGGVKKLELVGDVMRTGVLTLRRVGGAWKAEIPDELRYPADLLAATWKEKAK